MVVSCSPEPKAPFLPSMTGMPVVAVSPCGMMANGPMGKERKIRPYMANAPVGWALARTVFDKITQFAVELTNMIDEVADKSGINPDSNFLGRSIVVQHLE